VRAAVRRVEGGQALVADQRQLPGGATAQVGAGAHRHAHGVHGAAAAGVDLAQPAVEAEQPQRVAAGHDAALGAGDRHVALRRVAHRVDLEGAGRPDHPHDALADMHALRRERAPGRLGERDPGDDAVAARVDAQELHRALGAAVLEIAGQHPHRAGAGDDERVRAGAASRAARDGDAGDDLPGPPSHRRQPAADPLAHHCLRGVQLARDLAVRALVDHVRGDRRALLGGQLFHEGARLVTLAEPLDAGDVLVGELDSLHAEPPPRAHVGVAAPLGVGSILAPIPNSHALAGGPPGLKRRRLARAAANVSARMSAAISASNVRRAKKPSMASTWRT
jgi:hypothetical protein